ncbi:MAG TPA: acetate/propionate family kinase [Halothiobacillaceae bacterium]|nr:acetate/propionate family kinase [Halothiobacillaceae bacterium]
MPEKKPLILTVNSGSSSLKLVLFDHSGQVQAQWLVERLCGANAQAVDAAGHKKPLPYADHQHALSAFCQHFGVDIAALTALIHRVVHGGAQFTNPIELTAQNRQKLAELDAIAPLHNPPARGLIENLAKDYPTLVQFACFDTTFHSTLPPEARTYALPKAETEAHQIRRYGFHGLSIAWALSALASTLNKPQTEINAIVCHLGSGASLTAIKAGASIDTSMGFSPLGGLMMATRPGDLDPEIVHLLARRYSDEELTNLLNHRAGLYGLCGLTDMREIHQKRPENPAAELAFAVFVKRIRHFLGAYLLELSHIDALVFTGGIGENDPHTRSAVLSGLERFGIKLDAQKNQIQSGEIAALHTADSDIGIYRIASNEARQMFNDIQPLL